MVAACVVIPIPVSNDPYGDEETMPLLPGISTRAEVISLSSLPLPECTVPQEVVKQVSGRWRKDM
jgi:hypothetical protein